MSATVVDCVTMRTVLERARHVKLLKVDIEGGEYDIYSDIIANMDSIDFVIMETHAAIPGFDGVHESMISSIKQAGLAPRFNTDWI